MVFLAMCCAATAVEIDSTTTPKLDDSEDVTLGNDSTNSAAVPQSTAVRVVLRIRPMINRETNNKNGKSSSIVEVTSGTSLQVLDDPRQGSSSSSSSSASIPETRKFTFDSVLGEKSTQEEAYQSTAQGILLKVLQGYNGCIFAYGQTGSGKTFTMEGLAGTAIDATSTTTNTTTKEGMGVIPRMCEEFFSKLTLMAEGKGGDPTTASKTNSNNNKNSAAVMPIENAVAWTWALNATYCEIYMEKITDLLTKPTASSSSSKTHDDDTGAGGPMIRQKPDGSIYLEGVTSRAIRNQLDITALLAEGQGRRTKGETNMNAASSRSHAVLTLNLTLSKGTGSDDVGCVVKESGGGGASATTSPTASTSAHAEVLTRTCKLHLIDLAGSERADATGATGARLAEGAKINLSLTALGGVINALTTPGRAHIPYRDSKLTRLLQDSLGGNAFTCMICCVSPASVNYDETLASLRFAERAKKVTNVAKIGMDPTVSRIAGLVENNRALRARIRALERALARRSVPVDAASLEQEEKTFGDELLEKKDGEAMGNTTKQAGGGGGCVIM